MVKHGVGTAEQGVGGRTQTNSNYLFSRTRPLKKFRGIGSRLVVEGQFA